MVGGDRGKGDVATADQELAAELDPPPDVIGSFDTCEAVPADLVDVHHGARRGGFGATRLAEEHCQEDRRHHEGG